MIYDCFMFFNEFDLLELRLEELDRVVDKFIAVEASRTHTGILKPYYLEKNLSRYEKWKDKLCVVGIDLPIFTNAQDADQFQRNQIMRGLKDLKGDDWVLIGDLDEIPDYRAVGRFEGVFAMRDHYWKWNYAHPNRWNGTVQVRGWRFNHTWSHITPQQCRDFRDLLIRYTGGWHFSWSIDPETKLKSFAHTELNTPDFKFDMSKHPADGQNLRVLNFSDELDWPTTLLGNLDKYKKYVQE